MIKIRKCADTTTTWAELRNAVHAGSNQLNVGDEIDIELKTGERVTLVCEQVKNGRTTFFTKDLLEDTHVMDDGWITGWKKHLGTMDGYLEKLFRLLPDDLRAAICGEKLRLLREREVFGENRYGKPENCEQLPRYQEPENRVKRLSGVPFPYWLASPYASYSAYFCSVSGGVCFGFDI